MNKPISIKILRDFGLLIGIMFPFIVGLILPAIGGHSFKTWTLFISLFSLLAALFKPNLLKLPYKIWMKFGYFLGWINSKIILGFVFLFVLQPIALIMKIFGYDPLRIKKRNVNTYREIRTNFKIDLKRIF